MSTIELIAAAQRSSEPEVSGHVDFITPTPAPPRVSEELQAHLVITGTGNYRVGAETFEVRRNRLVWLLPTVSYAILKASADLRVAVVRWNLELVRETAPGMLSSLATQVDVPESRVRSIVHVLHDVSVQEPQTQRQGLSYTLHRLWEEAKRHDSVPPTLHPFVQKAIAIMDNPEWDFDARKLSRTVGMSYNHLARLFRRELDMTLVDYHNKLCLERFLRNHRISDGMLQSALAAGFGSYAQFYRVFRQHLGVGPREYFRSHSPSQMPPTP